MSPYDSHRALAAELLKSAKIRNIEAGLPITTRWVPRAALVAGEALAKANGGGPNVVEKRMLGPAEMILVGAPPADDTGKAASASASTIPLTAGRLNRWVGDGLGSSRSQTMCGVCGGKRDMMHRGLGQEGWIDIGFRHRGSLSMDSVQPGDAMAIGLMLGSGGDGRP